MTFSALRNPLPFVSSMDWKIDGRLGEDRFFTLRLKERTEAARPEELVVFAIDVQGVWRDMFCALYRPMQTMKQGILKKVSKSWHTSTKSLVSAFGEYAMS